MLDTHKTYNNTYSNLKIQTIADLTQKSIFQKVDLRDTRFFGENKDKNIDVLQILVIGQNQGIIEYVKRG